MSHPELSNSTNEVPAVDFMALLGRCMGNFKMVERVIATFRDTGMTYLDQLQMAIEEGDFSAVEEISHRFKGAASNVSATGLTKLLFQAEQAGQKQNQAELLLILADLQLDWDEFLKFAQAFAPAPSMIMAH